MESHQVYLIGRHNKSAWGCYRLAGNSGGHGVEYIIMYCILNNDICKVRPILRPRLTLAGHKPDGREIPQAQTNESPTHTHPGIFSEKGRFFPSF